MGDVLSQNEIDSLLKALNEGELDVDEMKDTPDKPVKNYDFARPSKFSKEHLRTLEIIFEHYGRLLSTNLPVYLRKSVQVEVMDSEAVTYLEPLNGNIIVAVASKLGYSMVDRMLGGVGEPLDKSRDFSEIELLILERILIVCIELLSEPWQNVVEIHPRLERIETNSQFAQIISPNEMIAIVTVNIRIGDVEGLMNICLPFITLEPVMDKLNTKFWYSSIKKSDEMEYTEAIQGLISRAPVPIKAYLGKSTVSVHDFTNLQIGDIIRLDSKVDKELDIYVGNIRKFTALPGASGSQYAVRITSVIGEEQ